MKLFVLILRWKFSIMYNKTYIIMLNFIKLIYNCVPTYVLNYYYYTCNLKDNCVIN